MDAPGGFSAMGTTAAGPELRLGGAHQGRRHLGGQGMPAAARRAGDDIGVGQVPLPVGHLGLDLGIARQGCQFHGRFLTCAAAPLFMAWPRRLLPDYYSLFV